MDSKAPKNAAPRKLKRYSLVSSRDDTAQGVRIKRLRLTRMEAIASLDSRPGAQRAAG